jgi:hypothetical protein
MLGEVRAVSTVSLVCSVLVVLVATALWVRLQSFVIRLRAAQASSRWASNLRDLIALLGASAVVVGFHLCGVPWPAAVLFAGTLGVVLELLRRGPKAHVRRTMAVAVAFVLCVELWPAQLVAGANRIADVLFSREATSRPD